MLELTGNNTFSVVTLLNHSALVIQKAFRRKLKRNLERDRERIEQRRIAFDILDEFLTEYIQETVLPDILYDLFTNEDEYAEESNANQTAYSLYHEIQAEVIDASLNDLAQVSDKHTPTRHTVH